MRKAQRWAVVPLMAGCLAIGGGCGGGKPPVESSRDEATVKGRVTLFGKPATSGQIIFDPTNINRRDAPIRSAEIRDDGTYQVTTLIGPNSISVNVPRGGSTADGLSPELGLDVHAGENTLDITLPYTVGR